MNYDLDAIAEALAAHFQGIPTDTYNGEAWTITADGSAMGTMNAPALVIELDDLTYDLTMGRGADQAVFLAYLLVSEADSSSGQRLVRQLLSSECPAGSRTASTGRPLTRRWGTSWTMPR